MAEPLKHIYNPQFFDRLTPVLERRIRNFDSRKFIHLVFDNRWPDLELKARVRHVTTALHRFMPADFLSASSLIRSIAEDIRDSGEKGDFAWIFLPDYIECYGLQHPAESLEALADITRLVSAEFAVRPFILHFPDLTFAHMRKWSTHADPHARRLASEGCRPRLPWAPRIPLLVEKPALVLSILENLKQDPVAFVRRSVANNLNDIAKDHPDLVLEVCAKWSGMHPHTNQILKHGCRMLLKKGHVDALRMHGFDPSSKGLVNGFAIGSPEIKVGEDLQFGFEFINPARKASAYRLEYAIDYVTSTGRMSRKVFKILERELGGGDRVSIRRKKSFRNLTTRRHYKGRHVLSILANGKSVAATEFVVS